MSRTGWGHSATGVRWGQTGASCMPCSWDAFLLLANFYSSFKTPSQKPLFSKPVLTPWAESTWCLAMPVPSRQTRAEASQLHSQDHKMLLTFWNWPGTFAMPDAQEVTPAAISPSGSAKLCDLEGKARHFHLIQRPVCSGNSPAQACGLSDLGSQQLHTSLVYLWNGPEIVQGSNSVMGVSCWCLSALTPGKPWGL